MRKINKKSDYKKPIIITISALLVIALGIWGIVYLTTERVTARNISNYVTLGQYLGIEYEPISIEVTDEDVEDRINSTLGGFVEQVEVTDRAVRDGDVVIIDFAGFQDGVQFPGGTAEEQRLHIGSGQFIPGFEEQIIGYYIGDEFDIYLTFPEDYHAEELAGADVIFTINLREIIEEIIPELTDEFVSENFGVTVTEYRNQVRETLQAEREDAAENGRINAIWSMIMDNATIHRLPQNELNEAMERSLIEQENFAAMFGMNLASLASDFYGMTISEFIEFEIRPMAEQSVSQDLVLRAIAFTEGIDISDAELNEGAARFAEEFEFESAAQFIELNGRDIIRLQLITERVLELVLANAVAVN
ncbi:MAG: trigger factor [Defluviitaleaceae bacterium]|nr:trigger factor [Defluviitaleaceae bacterium]